jgi:hypothetical protein
MVLRILQVARHAGWLALLAACGAASACSSNHPAVPDAFIQATVGVGAMSGPQLCNFGSVQQWLNIGTPVGGKPTTVQDGNSQAGSTVHVSCTVATSGDGFDVSLAATQEGLTGGSVIITSPSGQGAVTQMGGTGISASFESETYGTYREDDCTISFTYQGGPVPDQPPLAAGRIWGHLSCPTAQVSGQTVMSPDGGTQDRQCDGEADFLFEQCGL